MACQSANSNTMVSDKSPAFQRSELAVLKNTSVRETEPNERQDDASYTSVTNQYTSPEAMLLTPEMIHRKAQQLVENLNNKRKQDADIIGDFKKALEVHAEKTISAMEQNLLLIYQHQSERMQTVLKDLFATLDRIATIEAELSQFKQVMRSLYEQLNGPD